MFGVQGSQNHSSHMDTVEYMHDDVAALNCAQIDITQCGAVENLCNIQNFYNALAASSLHPENLLQAKKILDWANATITIFQ